MKMKTGEPKCSCGGWIGATDSIDCGIDNDRAWERIVGFCEDCGKNYTWVDVYEYVGYEDLEQT